MLKRIEIENFKSWKLLGIDLNSITGLFGTNSSGKSSLLQFLLMLKQTKDSNDRSLVLDFGSAKTSTQLGNFHDVIFKHKEELRLNWSLNWTLSKTFEIVDPLESRKTILFSGNEMALNSAAGLRNKLLSTDHITYTFGNQEFSLRRKETRSSSFSLSTAGENTDFHFIRKQGRVWDIPGPVKSYAFPDQAKTYHQNADLLGDLEYSYEGLMDSIYYLGPLREYPKREYVWSGSSPIDVGPRGERVVDALLSAKSKNEERSLGYRKKKKSFEEIIAHWLKELKLIHDFEVTEIAPHSNLYKINVRKEPGSAPVMITDVGFGVSQILPVLALLYYVPEGSIVLLEQPEIHLHPAVQSGLADVIINATETRGIQVVVESHSEHLLRRLQLRVADQTISSDKVSLYFCQTKEGTSQSTPLDIDLFGTIENWPPNFFGDEFGEIAAINRAGLERKIANQS